MNFGNFCHIFQINGDNIVFRRDADTPETITKEYLVEKANGLQKFQELLETHNIKETSFDHRTNFSATLSIEMERKNKEKKKKKKQQKQ